MATAKLHWAAIGGLRALAVAAALATAWPASTENKTDISFEERRLATIAERVNTKFPSYSFSPDGRTVAYAAERGGTYKY